MLLDADTRDRLLRRIGLEEAPTADAAGLRTVHRAFASSVPFENLAVQLGESRALDPMDLVQRVLHGGRGGYCFELNTVLHVLLETLGFELERRQGIVGPRDDHANGEPTNHLTLVVDTHDEGPFLADVGWGEGPLDPLPLVSGPVTSGSFRRTIERDGDGWWVGQHEYGVSPGFRFADASSALSDFDPHHERTYSSPDSLFVKTLVLTRLFDDRIVSLRARTLFVDGPEFHERAVLADQQAFVAALDERFGIDPDVLGQERLDRLWAKASTQHDVHIRR